MRRTTITAHVACVGLLATTACGHDAPPPKPAPPAPEATGQPPGTPVASRDEPVAVARHHSAGQHYRIHLERTTASIGTPTVIEAEATVAQASEADARFRLAVGSITSSGKQVAANAKFVASARFGQGSPTIDVQQVSGPDAEMYLTTLEHALGDICDAPRAAHRAGDTWSERSSQWKLTAIEREGDRAFAKLEGTSSDGWTYALRLATDDGYSGTCEVVTKVAGDSQTWKLAVERLGS
jgi:hypothetical protein